MQHLKTSLPGEQNPWSGTINHFKQFNWMLYIWKHHLTCIWAHHQNIRKQSPPSQTMQLPKDHISSTKTSLPIQPWDSQHHFQPPQQLGFLASPLGFLTGLVARRTLRQAPQGPEKRPLNQVVFGVFFSTDPLFWAQWKPFIFSYGSIDKVWGEMCQGSNIMFQSG